MTLEDHDVQTNSNDPPKDRRRRKEHSSPPLQEEDRDPTPPTPAQRTRPLDPPQDDSTPRSRPTTEDRDVDMDLVARNADDAPSSSLAPTQTRGQFLSTYISDMHRSQDVDRGRRHGARRSQLRQCWSPPDSDPRDISDQRWVSFYVCLRRSFPSQIGTSTDLRRRPCPFFRSSVSFDRRSLCVCLMLRRPQNSRKSIHPWICADFFSLRAHGYSLLLLLLMFRRHQHSPQIHTPMDLRRFLLSPCTWIFSSSSSSCVPSPSTFPANPYTHGFAQISSLFQRILSVVLFSYLVAANPCKHGCAGFLLSLSLSLSLCCPVSRCTCTLPCHIHPLVRGSHIIRESTMTWICGET